MKLVSSLLVLSMGTFSYAQQAAPEDPMNPFGWPELVVPESENLEITVDWATACERDANQNCADQTERGPLFSCLMDSSTSDYQPKCLKAIRARNAKTLRDYNVYMAEQAATADTTITTVQPAEAEATTQELPTAEESDYRVGCADEIMEFCEEAAASAVKGELFSCLMKYRADQIELTGDDTVYSDSCESTLYARFQISQANNPPPEGKASGGGQIIETCTTPFRIRTVGKKSKCVQYTKTGTTSFKPCDMANKAQQFLVRPATGGGYRFIDIDRKLCIDSDFIMKNCGLVEAVWDMHFIDVANGYQIKNRQTTDQCLGGDAKTPSAGQCLGDVDFEAANQKGKAGKNAKATIEAMTFAVEAAFGQELGFGVQG